MLCDLTPCELSYLATSFAVCMTDGLDNKSIKVLCSFFADVIGTLNLIAVQRSFLEDSAHDKKK
ncbi:MAG: hypothetical protein GX424_10790 [Clostridiales bacterium]|jgi:hypothetical protein|nr:hypothetical protein [Clostridiales bacterium]